MHASTVAGKLIETQLVTELTEDNLYAYLRVFWFERRQWGFFSHSNRPDFLSRAPSVLSVLLLDPPIPNDFGMLHGRATSRLPSTRDGPLRFSPQFHRTSQKCYFLSLLMSRRILVRTPMQGPTLSQCWLLCLAGQFYWQQELWRRLDSHESQSASTSWKCCWKLFPQYSHRPRWYPLRPCNKSMWLFGSAPILLCPKLEV